VFLLIMLALPRGILPTITDRLRQRGGRARAGRPDPPADPTRFSPVDEPVDDMVPGVSGR